MKYDNRNAVIELEMNLKNKMAAMNHFNVHSALFLILEHFRVITQKLYEIPSPNLVER